MSPMSWMLVVAATTLFLILLCITIIDGLRQIIPNWLNLALAFAGIIWQWALTGIFPLTAIAVGAGMFALLWTVRAVHMKARGYVGLGLGDVKMAGAGSIWLGPLFLPAFLLFASASGLCFVVVRALKRGEFSATERMPFGPFLAVGLFATFMVERYSFS